MKEVDGWRTMGLPPRPWNPRPETPRTRMEGLKHDMAVKQVSAARAMPNEPEPEPEDSGSCSGYDSQWDDWYEKQDRR